MKVVKFIPEAGLAVCELSDGTAQYITAKTKAEAQAILSDNNTKHEAQKAEKQAEKDAENENAVKINVEKKALKALPDVLAFLSAVKFRASVTFADELQAALNKLEG